MEDLAHGQGHSGDEEHDQLEKILALSREKLMEAEGDIDRLRLGMGKVCVFIGLFFTLLSQRGRSNEMKNCTCLLVIVWFVEIRDA